MGGTLAVPSPGAPVVLQHGSQCFSPMRFARGVNGTIIADSCKAQNPIPDRLDATVLTSDTENSSTVQWSWAWVEELRTRLRFVRRAASCSLAHSTLPALICII